MKKMFFIGAIGIGLLLIAVLGFYFVKLSDDKVKPPKANANLSNVVDIDEIVRYPERFKDFIGVVGKVIKVDESKGSFVLGCEDACVMMPVKYEGRPPEAGSEITVYGEIKETEGQRYIFEGQKIKPK